MKAPRHLLLAALLLTPLAPALAGGISTSTTNGETVVEWNGKEVFRGKVEGPVRSKASGIDGSEKAAVTVEDRVLWESEAGAAAALELVDPPEEAPAGAAQIKIENRDGQSIVTFQGKEVWKGKTKHAVSAKAKDLDGETYAAAFDGKRVIWENVPGSAKKLGRPVKQALPLVEAPRHS